MDLLHYKGDFLGPQLFSTLLYKNLPFTNTNLISLLYNLCFSNITKSLMYMIICCPSLILKTSSKTTVIQSYHIHSAHIFFLTFNSIRNT